MSLIRYEPWALLNRFPVDVNRLLEDRFGPDDSRTSVSDWVPAVDIKEEQGRFVLRVDVPGVEAEDTEVTMENDVLTVRGERQIENRERKDGYRRVERVGGRFYRRFTLPDTADSDAITARSQNGVLEVVIPKQPQLQPRRISVELA
ncbi:MAG: Hsp20/alpha crystallin family protein [Gammaproteobacteria bacterium]